MTVRFGPDSVRSPVPAAHLFFSPPRLFARRSRTDGVLLLYLLNLVSGLEKKKRGKKASSCAPSTILLPGCGGAFSSSSQLPSRFINFLLLFLCIAFPPLRRTDFFYYFFSLTSPARGRTSTETTETTSGPYTGRPRNSVMLATLSRHTGSPTRQAAARSALGSNLPSPIETVPARVAWPRSPDSPQAAASFSHSAVLFPSRPAHRLPPPLCRESPSVHALMLAQTAGKLNRGPFL